MIIKFWIASRIANPFISKIVLCKSCLRNYILYLNITVINILKQWIQLILQTSGDNPDCPYIFITVPTGTAAANIKGQTLHSTFGFNFGNEHFSLSDKKRDEKRSQLQHLRVVVIDEISMVKSDLLFQLDMRLKEVTQKIDKPLEV